MNKKILRGFLTTGAIVGSLVLGYFVGKKTNEPHKISGSLCVDHRNGEGSPDIYLNGVDSELILDTGSLNSVVLEVIHLRK